MKPVLYFYLRTKQIKYVFARVFDFIKNSASVKLCFRVCLFKEDDLTSYR